MRQSAGTRPLYLQRGMNTRGGLLCAKQIADLFAITERSAAKLMRTGQIRGFKLGGRIWRTTRREVEIYVARELAKREPAA